MVISVGILYSKIFKQDLATYLPFLAIGLVVWQMLATVINESCDVFTSAGQMIKQIKVPLTVHVCRLVICSWNVRADHESTKYGDR
jgi:ABC-type polysaccharide/polyol phosphate export permease